MRINFASTLKKYNKENLISDLISGLIIVAVSIPISMGYAQIAGLQAVYGLYGSVFPVILFALFSTSPQFVFGVDAAPAALVGSALLSLEISPETEQAAIVVPVITFWVAVWLLAFSILKTGKLVSYISAPVMGGFISGICTEIILMQIPKLMGGTAGTGELPELMNHIVKAIKNVNVRALIIGLITLAILIISKKLLPKFPMAVILMIIGALITRYFPALVMGVDTLQRVETGLPNFIIPKFFSVPFADVMTLSLSIAVVIMAETLLAENNFAVKNGYRIDNNQELFAFSLSNFAAAFTGCCPVNGSVSRTAMKEQYQGKTQLSGIVAAIVMGIILVCATGFIEYLPIPVLTAIVISALMGATEFELSFKLWKISKKECLIFWGAFFGVLMLGTINGVLVGMILSFAEMIIRSAKPARCFLGIQPGHSHFREINERQQIYPLKDVIIYKFSSSLFFANIEILQRDIEDSLEEKTKAVIIDASGIGSIDITAADRLDMLYKSLKEREIRLYLTEHIAGLNEQLRALGLGYLIEEGAVRRTIHVALKDLGYNRPYPLKGDVKNEERSAERKRLDNKIQEFSWAFGTETEEIIEKQIQIQLEQLKVSGDVKELIRGNWGYKEAMDEDEWLAHLEQHLKEIVAASGKDEKTLLSILESSRKEIYKRLLDEKPEMAEKFEARRVKLDEEMKERYPEIYNRIQKIRE